MQLQTNAVASTSACPSAPPPGPCEAALLRWRALHSSMAQIVGERAATALIRHSLRRTQPKFGWLTLPDGGDPLRGLQSGLSRQSVENAASATHAIDREITALIARLFGASIAARLLAGAARPAPDAASARSCRRAETHQRARPE